MAKGEIFAFVIIVLIAAVRLLSYWLCRWLYDMAWTRAREHARWFSHSMVLPNGDVRVVVRREARVGWASEVIGESVTVEIVPQANVQSGLLQEVLGRADILADNYNYAE